MSEIIEHKLRQISKLDEIRIEKYSARMWEVYYPRRYYQEKYPHPSLSKLYKAIEAIGYRVEHPEAPGTKEGRLIIIKKKEGERSE